MKGGKQNVKFLKENRQCSFNAVSVFFPEKVSRKSSIHRYCLPWTSTMGTTVSSHMTTIASRDQFKPIRFGENLMVNYSVV